ncbi:formate antiporter [Moniliophthora roreri]|nr:formate antiporter [Moniliophthora roreri]
MPTGWHRNPGTNVLADLEDPRLYHSLDVKNFRSGYNLENGLSIPRKSKQTMIVEGLFGVLRETFRVVPGINSTRLTQRINAWSLGGKKLSSIDIPTYRFLRAFRQFWAVFVRRAGLPKCVDDASLLYYTRRMRFNYV